MFNKNVIILKGGPQDGKKIHLSNDAVKHGVFRIAMLKQPEWTNEPADYPYPTAVVPVEKHRYYRTKVTAGEPNTCEYREWMEWNYDGMES
jgi:hypothetical protein